MSFLLVKTVYMATRFTEVSTSSYLKTKANDLDLLLQAVRSIHTPCCTLSQAVKARRLLLSTADTQGLPDGTNWRLATSTSWSSVQLEGQDSLALNQTRQTCSDPECQQSNNDQIWMAPISPISLSLDGLYKLSFWIGFCKVLKKCGNIWESKIRDYSSHWVEYLVTLFLLQHWAPGSPPTTILNSLHHPYTTSLMRLCITPSLLSGINAWEAHINHLAYHFSLREVQLCGILSLEVVECRVGRTFNMRTALFLASDNHTGITQYHRCMLP